MTSPAPTNVSADSAYSEHYLRRELLERVQVSPEIFEFLRQSALDGLWYWDLEKPAIEWMDNRFWETLGYDPKMMPHLASSWQELIHPDDLKTATHNFECHLANPNHPYDQIVRYQHANGSTVWVRCRGLILRNDAGKPVRMLGTHVDVTRVELARQVSERANRELEERVRVRTLELEDVNTRLAEVDKVNEHMREVELRQLVDGLPLLVWTCLPEGPCDYLSAQWVAYTGIPESEQLGSGWLAQLHPDDVPVVQKAWGASVAMGQPLETEFRIRRHDGMYRWFQTRARPLRGPDGRVVKWFGTNSDIHDRKMLEETLRDRTSALERSNAELEQFAYVASHDLQEPLRTVTSYVQLLERRYGSVLDERGRQYVAHVVTGARKMRSLIVDLLDYSRATMAPTEGSSIDANEALASARASLEVLFADSGAKLTSSQLPVVMMDSGSLIRIFQNLLSNAIHYRSDRPLEIKIQSTIDGEYCTITVEDNGVGIAPEYQRRIFLMFQRVHTDLGRPGTGVGLALCRRLVERFHGEIWVESIVGVGSTFHMRLRLGIEDKVNE